MVFSDAVAGDRLGFSVASAGDYNGDGGDDIMIGAPGLQRPAGRPATPSVDLRLRQGRPRRPRPTRINGVFVITPTAPATTRARRLVHRPDASATSPAISVAPTAHIAFGTDHRHSPGFDILIGAPGVEPGHRGGLPHPRHGTALTGVRRAQRRSAPPLNGSQFIASRRPATVRPSRSSPGFGTSVSARNPVFDPNTLGDDPGQRRGPRPLHRGARSTSLVSPNSPTTSTTRGHIAGVAYAVEGGLDRRHRAVAAAVAGGGGGGTGDRRSAFARRPLGLLTPPIFTGETPACPSRRSPRWSTFQLPPLPVQIAYQQFLPAARLPGPPGGLPPPEQKATAHQAPRGTYPQRRRHRPQRAPVRQDEHPAARSVFTRGKFKHGKTITFTHKVKVIPRSQQTETFTSG